MKNIFDVNLNFPTSDLKSLLVESGIVACIEALSAHDLQALERYAKFRMADVRGRVCDADEDDLLQEAIERVLDGRRTWNPEKVDLVKLLKGCMRSIADEWYKKSKNTESTDQCESKSKEHAEVEARITIDSARATLPAHSVAQSVFDLMRQGYSRLEIQQELKISEQAYNAARKTISRRLEQAASRGGTTDA